MNARVLCAIAFAVGCSDDADTQLCDGELDAHAGVVQTDGSVTVYGGVSFGSGEELAVFGVDVADQAADEGSDFNFQTWSVSLDADHLAAFVIAGSGGSRQARLPARASLYGGCLLSLAPEDEPVVLIPTGSGSGSG